MKILLSNDDGIMATGLSICHELLRDLGHEVYIVAPLCQESGVSHTLTLGSPLIPQRISKKGKFYGLAINGSPSDAVKLGVTSLYPQVDMVISGINLGNNAGPAIYYSGTVAAAFEGIIAGKPARSLSFDSLEEDDFKGLQRKLEPFMTSFLELPEQQILYNINIPHTNKIEGVRITRQFLGFFNDYYERRINPRNHEYYWLSNPGYTEREDRVISPEKDRYDHYNYMHDLQALSKGYISLTPLQFDLTHYPHMEALCRIFPNI